MTTFEADQVQAAITETRRLLTATRPNRITTTSDDPWVDNLLGHLVEPGLQLCRHIERAPVQPAFAYSAERHIRCLRCHNRHPRPTCRNCDRCGSNGTLDPLNPALLSIGPWVVIATLCAPCEIPFRRTATQEADTP